MPNTRSKGVRTKGKYALMNNPPKQKLSTKTKRRKISTNSFESFVKRLDDAIFCKLVKPQLFSVTISIEINQQLLQYLNVEGNIFLFI
jgi:hypothetical protein